MNMTFTIWYAENVIPLDTIPPIVKSNKISLLNEIIEIMKFSPSIPDEVNTCVQKLRNLEEVDAVFALNYKLLLNNCN